MGYRKQKRSGVVERFITIAFQLIIVLLWVGLAMLVQGCATTEVRYVVAEVPQPPVIARPSLAVADLKAGDDAATVVRLHRTTIMQLQQYAAMLEEYLNAYRKKQ